MNKIVLHLKAKNDSNGNPRRLYLVADLTEQYDPIAHIIEEGHRGRAGLKGLIDANDHYIPINVPYSEYREWVTFGKDTGVYIP